MQPRVIIIGFGFHGARIASAVLDRGGRLVGIADPAVAGAVPSDLAGRDGAELDRVDTTAEQVVDRVSADVAIVAATLDLTELQRITLLCFDRGINVLTLHPDAFDPPAPWTLPIDEAGRRHGTSFLATGVQDLWWVHMPALAAATSASITAVRVTHRVDIEDLPLAFGNAVGLGKDVEGFAAVRDEVLMREDSVLGAPLRVLARRLGLTPLELERRLEPAVAAQPMSWRTGGATIAAGCVSGFAEHVTIATDEGVTFHGTIVTALLAPGEAHSDRVVLEGDPELTLEHRPFPGTRITDLVPVARIPDIIDAAPGFHTAASMPPPAHRRSLALPD